MTIRMEIQAKSLTELADAAAAIAEASGAGTITRPDDVDPEILFDVLNAWAEARGGVVRLTLKPRSHRTDDTSLHGMGRPRFMSVAELENLYQQAVADGEVA